LKFRVFLRHSAKNASRFLAHKILFIEIFDLIKKTVRISRWVKNFFCRQNDELWVKKLWSAVVFFPFYSQTEQ